MNFSFVSSAYSEFSFAALQDYNTCWTAVIPNHFDPADFPMQREKKFRTDQQPQRHRDRGAGRRKDRTHAVYIIGQSVLKNPTEGLH